MIEQHYEPESAAQTADRCFVISGCSGGGKSTLLAALAREGFTVFEEPGRQIVKEQQFIGGNALPWSDARMFVELAASRAMYQRIRGGRAAGHLFFDRGVVDALSFLEYLNLPVPAHLEMAARRLRYADVVFMTPPWMEIFATDAERRHGFEQAVAQYAVLRRSYQRLGYLPLEIPKGPLAERVRFVVEQLRRDEG